MKWPAILMILTLTVILPSAAAGGEQTEVVDSYLAVHDALAKDEFAKAKSALQTLAKSSSGEIHRLALEAAASTDIKKLRAGFVPLSLAVSKLDLPGGYVIASCPMADGGKGAVWVQKDGKVRNPYYGSSMLSCGTIQKK